MKISNKRELQQLALNHLSEIEFKRLQHYTKDLFPFLVNDANLTFHCTKTFSIKEFFSKCDQIRRKLRIWSHLMTKS